MGGRIASHIVADGDCGERARLSRLSARTRRVGPIAYGMRTCRKSSDHSCS